jgi:hypothetical protein
MGPVSGCDGPAKHSLILPQNSPVLFSSFYLLHDCVIADEAALGNNRTQYMVRTIIGLLRLQEMLKLSAIYRQVEPGCRGRIKLPHCSSGCHSGSAQEALSEARPRLAPSSGLKQSALTR